MVGEDEEPDLSDDALRAIVVLVFAAESPGNRGIGTR
jgi:hypothetical protein